MDMINPLSFFNSGREKYLGERFYWKDPSEESCDYWPWDYQNKFSRIRLLTAFFMLKRNGRNFLQDSLIFNPYTENGLGLLCLEASPFDPL